MRKIAISFLVLLFIGCGKTALAQNLNNVTGESKCDGAVYKVSEVSKKAIINFRPFPHSPPNAPPIEGKARITAVFCKTGEVADLRVIGSSSDEMTQVAIESARQIEFTPAEKDGQKVSQLITIEYSLSSMGGVHPLASEPVEGKAVYEIVIDGLNHESLKEAWKQLKTGDGNPYSKEQAQRDLQMLCKLCSCDEKESSIRVEEGTMGGLRVVFNLKEKAPMNF